MMLAACDLLRDNPDPSEDEVREGIEGNLCRCTGYQNIVAAVQAAGQAMRARRRRRRSAESGACRPDRVRRSSGGLGMTTTDDRPDVADGPVPEIGQPRKRKEDAAPDHRPDHLDRQPDAARHGAPGDPAQPDGARPDHRRRRLARRCRGPACWPPTPAGTSPRPRAASRAPGRSPRRWSTPAIRAWPSTRSTTSARRSPWWWPATRPRPRTRWRPSTSTTSRCRWCSTWRPRSPTGADLVHAHTESNRSFTWIFESGAAGTGAPIDEVLGQAEVTVQPPVRAAAADPGVHGAPLDRGAARRRRAS